MVVFAGGCWEAKVLNGDLSGVDASDDHGSRSMIGAMESLGRQDMAKRSSDFTPISTHEHIPTYANATYPVTSILTCILCSCCCNNCVAMFSGAGGGRRGGRLLWAWGGANASAPAARALSPQEKARLPIAPYDPGESNLYNFRECCICLTDFERTDLVRKLPCGHVYHSEVRSEGERPREQRERSWEDPPGGEEPRFCVFSRRYGPQALT